MPDATPASSAAAIPADAVGRYDRRSGIRPEPTPAQRRAVEARRPLVALSAGAGSGKTKVLVDRFLALVDEGVSPLAILAVTFTDKAALEMKERIVVRFAERGDDENRRKAEVAYISTLHGFCARLLREHPLEARLDPAFAVMDDLTRGLFLDEALESLYEDEWFRERVELFAEDRETKRPVLFELIHDSAFAAREFGRAARGAWSASIPSTCGWTGPWWRACSTSCSRTPRGGAWWWTTSRTTSPRPTG